MRYCVCCTAGDGSWPSPPVPAPAHPSLFPTALPSRHLPLQNLAAFIAAQPGACGIVYARLRATCDWLAAALSARGLEVAKYHAGALLCSAMERWSGGLL